MPPVATPLAQARTHYIVSSVNDIAGRDLGGQHAPVVVQPERPGPDETLPPGQAAAAELFTAISVIRRTARRAARQARTQQPLPPAQSELLRLAAARPGLTVAEAAVELRVAPNTISTLAPCPRCYASPTDRPGPGQRA